MTVIISSFLLVWDAGFGEGTNLYLIPKTKDTAWLQDCQGKSYNDEDQSSYEALDRILNCISDGEHLEATNDETGIWKEYLVTSKDKEIPHYGTLIPIFCGES